MRPETTPAGTATPPAATAATATAPRVPFGRGAKFGISVTAGLAAGLLAFAAIVATEVYQLRFRLSDEVLPLADKERLTEEEMETLQGAFRLQAYQNTALIVAVFGTVVGGLLGFAAGLSRRSPFAASAGLVGGMVAGAAAGAIGGVVDLFALEQLWPLDFDHSFKSMAGHSAAFLIAGLGIGVAAGLAARRVPQTLGVVLAAALIAGLTYPGLAAALFPVLNTDAAVPEGFFSLLLWTVLPAGLMGLAVGRTKAAGLPAVAQH